MIYACTEFLLALLMYGLAFFDFFVFPWTNNSLKWIGLLPLMVGIFATYLGIKILIEEIKN